MSPKKKAAPAKSALKDDLIDALFESEGDGGLSLESTQSAAKDAAKKKSPRPPPPPPAQDENDRIYNFDITSTAAPSKSPYSNEDVYDASKDDTRPAASRPDVNEAPTLSIVRNPTPKSEVQMFEVPPDLASSLSLESDDPSAKTIPPFSAPEKSVPEKSAPKSGAKLQRLEDVLNRLKPNKAPIAPPVTAPAPAGQQSERAPTEPVRTPAAPVTSPQVSPVASPAMSTAGDDEKTVAVAAKPQEPVRNVAAPSREPASSIYDDNSIEDLAVDPEGEKFMPTQIRPNSPGARFREEARQAQPGAAIFSSAEAALRQSENLRIAQKRISDLENELERVRRENENLRSAGETLRRRMDELQANAENAEANAQESKKIAEEERKVLKGQIQSRDREIGEMKNRLDDAENRLEANFRKIRVRERDLEHRIEIIKAESQSITASKDRMILELKRQIDQISSELNHAKSQVQETFGQFKEKQETARRAVRALRIALTVLEGEEDSGSRKAE